MGFRELEAFNQPLLAKQLWRILTRPNLLVSKILKGRYFRGISIWSVKTKHSDSWYWKSILSARRLLEEGSRKRVGDGKTSSIWKDKWVPGNEEGLIKTKKQQEWNVSKVSDLIKEGRWNTEMLSRLFEVVDQVNIMNIPLSLHDTKDKIYWCKTPTGEYSVKSGYRCAKELQRTARPKEGVESSGSRKEENAKSWKTLWGLNMKQKLKFFIWKCLRGIVPTNERIKERCLKGDTICRCYEEKPESIEHMLFYCSHAEAIWKIAPIQWDGLEELKGKFWLWWMELDEAMNRENRENHITFTVNLLWQNWKSRNDIRFNGKRKKPRLIINKAMSEWLEYQGCAKTD